jgi:hypothetical protein
MGAKMRSKNDELQPSLFLGPQFQKFPAHSKVVTWEKIKEKIKAGQGQGHFENYTPWIRVTRHWRNAKSVSGHLAAPELNRHHHNLSANEHIAIQFFKWLGAVDVREQFPIWPFEHDHPIVGLPGVANLAKCRGLTEIAKEAGIKHGKNVGSSSDYVATIDMLTTWHTQNSFKLIAIDCKPYDLNRIDTASMRDRERLELARRYCKENNIHWCLFNSQTLPKNFVKNLDALCPTLKRQEIIDLKNSQHYSSLVTLLNSEGTRSKPFFLIKQFASENRLEEQQVFVMFKYGVWTQDIDHNFENYFDTWNHLIPGGKKLKEQMRARFLGELEIA